VTRRGGQQVRRFLWARSTGGHILDKTLVCQIRFAVEDGTAPTDGTIWIGQVNGRTTGSKTRFAALVPRDDKMSSQARGAAVRTESSEQPEVDKWVDGASGQTPIAHPKHWPDTVIA
jgi:hypothetical protein